MGKIVEGDRSGIEIDYVKSRRHICISGWYDSFVGIESINYPIAEFLTKLGITVKDMDKIKADMHRIEIDANRFPLNPTKADG